MSHVHCFRSGSNVAIPTLVLLHGSGVNEHEVVPFADDLAPGITDPRSSWRHSVRSRVRNLSPLPGSVGRRGRHCLACRDPGGLHQGRQDTRYSLTRTPIAIGFSNGAILAATLFLTRPGLLEGAILFRLLSPFRDDPPSRRYGTPALIIDGEKDTRRSAGDGAILAECPTWAGAASHIACRPSATQSPRWTGKLQSGGWQQPACDRDSGWLMAPEHNLTRE
jgi:phospholipase/carboxylesterase